MQSIAVTLGLSFAGTVALWGLYRALELNWPEQYVSLNDTFALRVTQTWWRYLIYRFIPVFAAGIGVWATAERVNGMPVVAVCIMSLIHVGHTNLLALFEAFGKLQKHPKFKINYASYHLLMIAIIAFATVASCLLGPSLGRLVPAPHVLLENLWIAVFIAIVGGIAIAVIGRRPSDASGFGPEYFVERAKRDIDIELIDWAFEEAVANKCDPILVRSIMFAEVLQRPGWVRRLERAKGLIFKKGSYGVTQESSDYPISDRESISRTAVALTHSWAMQRDAWGWHALDGLIWKYASLHNEDIPFMQGVQKIYRAIQQDPKSVPIGSQNPDFHLIEIRRYAKEFGLRGITLSDVLGFSFQTDTDLKGEVKLERPTDVAGDEPWAFECRMPVETLFLQARLYSNSSEVTLKIPIFAASI